MVQISDTALRISFENLRAALVSDVKFQMHLLTYVHAFQFQIAQTAACNASHDVEQRCARWILTARDRIGRDEFALTHEFLAMMLSVRRAGVTMAAGFFEKAGFIENRRGQITIRDVDGLKEVSCECYRLIREEEERLLS
jgi:CRP-like cAMP-binding protein